MMKQLIKTIGLSIFALVITQVTQAQQEQHWTVSSLINRITINPAYAGSEDYTDFKVGYRTQWVGMDAAPVTMYATGHTTIGKEYGSGHGHHKGEKHSWFGVGGYIYQDNTGPIRRTGFYGMSSLNMEFNHHDRLSLGVSLGAKQFTLRSDWNALDTDDGILLETDQAKLVPDLNIGAYYYSKSYYVGISMFQALQSDLSLDALNNAQEAAAKLTSHFFLTGGVKLPMSEEINVIPAFTFKYSYPTTPSLDLSARVHYGDKYFVGGAYRIGDSFSILGGIVLLDRYEIAYSFDLTNSELRDYNSGTHEIILGLRLPHKKELNCPDKWWHK